MYGQDRLKYIPLLHTGPPYPGLGLSLRAKPWHYHDSFPLGIYCGCGSETQILPVRELAMMHIMDRITDKPDWSNCISKDSIVEEWREEARSIPDIEWWNIAIKDKGIWGEGKEDSDDDDGDEDHGPSPFNVRCQLEGIVTDDTFAIIIEELRAKAEYFNKTGIIVTLDAKASVAKSDSLVPSWVHQGLREAFDKLIADQSCSSKSNSEDVVQCLVDPSMYPLVYGRSKVFGEEIVGIEDAIRQWSGKGSVIGHIGPEEQKRNLKLEDVPADFWNESYQWLPANVMFEDNGKVKFTSYINNLNPSKYVNVYTAIESLIEVTLPLWDQCLRTGEENEELLDGADQELNRRTQSRFPYPDSDENCGWLYRNWIPRNPKKVSDVEVEWEKVPDWYRGMPEEEELRCKWMFLRKARLPEAEFTKVGYTPENSIRLCNKFRETGLQVIVKMVSIELTPEKPECPMEPWHFEGQFNERICASALYYLDCENVAPSNMEFRMQTDDNMQDDFRVGDGDGDLSWMHQVWGTDLRDSGPCLQNYGSVETRRGRLLAYPNAFHRRASPVSLVDRTKPGYQRFISLCLVDPHVRIISTANVPPQQQDWWLESVSGDSTQTELAHTMGSLSLESPSPYKKETRLPAELMNTVWEEFASSEDRGLFTEEEASKHRLELARKRTKFEQDCESAWHDRCYSYW